MIDPTYEEWRAACERMRRTSALPGEVRTRRLTAAALGCPCPPEPPPEPFCKGGHTLVAFYVEQVFAGEHALTPDEADVMAAALIEHARYAREQEVGR